MPSHEPESANYAFANAISFERRCELVYCNHTKAARAHTNTTRAKNFFFFFFLSCLEFFFFFFLCSQQAACRRARKRQSKATHLAIRRNDNVLHKVRVARQRLARVAVRRRVVARQVPHNHLLVARAAEPPPHRTKQQQNNNANSASENRSDTAAPARSSTAEGTHPVKIVSAASGDVAIDVTQPSWPSITPRSAIDSFIVFY